ncbi:MAG TPA: ParA family protein [Bryobacteraceae bacterium]|nr:ParA family protein [Bryobacteraceae bacterium]
MTTLLPQDIAQLASDADFALKQYRTFDRPTRAKPPAPDPATEIHAIARAIQKRPAPVEAGIADLIIPPVEYDVSRVDRPFRALDALRNIRQSRLRTQRKTTVALFASAGGCGVTTIAATLTRLLSGSRESVALVDDAPQSLLGVYFGLRGLSAGVRTLLPPESSARASVHIVNRPRTAGENWVTGACQQLDGEFDRMIVDVSPAFPQNYLQSVLRDAVAIVPILPDVRTASRLDPLLERLTALSSDCGSPLPIYLLLSQFDPNVRLHCEIEDWLHGSFGSMVLPLTLRRGDEVSEAMADGGTVIDYAPNSGIASDFRALAAWIRQLPTIGLQE